MHCETVGECELISELARAVIVSMGPLNISAGHDCFWIMATTTTAHEGKASLRWNSSICSESAIRIGGDIRRRHHLIVITPSRRAGCLELYRSRAAAARHIAHDKQ
jgi:hypothetical protein